MRSDCGASLDIIAFLISWFAVSSGLGLEVLRRHLPPLLPIRTARVPRVPKYYYLLKTIPRIHPDYTPDAEEDYTDMVISDVLPVDMNPVIEKAALLMENEAIIDRYTVTHEVTRVRRKRGQNYSKYLRHPLNFRLKRGPIRGMFGLDNHDFVLTALSREDVSSLSSALLESQTGWRRQRHRVQEPPPNRPPPGRMSVGQGASPSSPSQQPTIKFLHRKILELRQRERILETKARMFEMLNAGKRKR